MMDQNLVTIGITLVLAGLVIGLLSSLLSNRSHTPPPNERRGGGVIIVGPLPIIFGSDPETARVLLILSIILVLVLMGLFVLRVFT